MSKIIHLAAKVSQNGDVSPLCANRPRKINLARESWTLRGDAVTCTKCKAHNRKAVNGPEVTKQ